MFISKTLPILAALITTTQMTPLPETPAPSKENPVTEPQTTINVALNAVIHTQNAENEAQKHMNEQKNPMNVIKLANVAQKLSTEAQNPATTCITLAQAETLKDTGLEMQNIEAETATQAHKEPNLVANPRKDLEKVEEYHTPKSGFNQANTPNIFDYMDHGPVIVPPGEFDKPPSLSIELKDILEAELANYTGRTMPPELAIYIDKNMGEADQLQECMQEFTYCLRAHKSAPFCGKNKKEKRKFENICEMAYFNCKLSTDDDWHFLQDGSCDPKP